MIVHLNYLSDFIIKERFKTSSGDPIAIPDECDFTLTYRTSPYRDYVASRIDGVYHNCAPASGGKLLVMFNEHGLDRGVLMRTAQFDFRNSVVPDGFLSVVSPESTNIELWQYESETHGVVDCDALLNYVKGDEGAAPVFESGNIVSGEPKSAPVLNLVNVGHTPEGNPLYRIDGSIPKGDGLHSDGYFNTLDELVATHPTGDTGMYIVGDGDLYGWDAVVGAWEFAGHIKGDKGDAGLSPVLEVGDVATGEPGSTVSLTLTPSGTTPEGNPIYTLGATIPKGASGDDGLIPVLEVGEVLTGTPGSEASLTLTENGITPDGNPIYQLNATLPRGDKGDRGGAGEGTWIIPEEWGANFGTLSQVRYKNIGDSIVLIFFIGNSGSQTTSRLEISFGLDIPFNPNIEGTTAGITRVERVKFVAHARGSTIRLDTINGEPWPANVDYEALILMPRY